MGHNAVKLLLIRKQLLMWSWLLIHIFF